MLSTLTRLNLRNGLIAGVLAELIIFCFCYFSYIEPGEVFLHAARYSGRFSFFVYLFVFSYFALTFQHEEPEVMPTLKKVVTIFCVLHFIHFGFLVTNVVLNEIELVPYKMAGGFLGYLFILFYPFLFERIKNKKLHFIYFFYLGIIMIVTYLSRIQGQTPGVTAEPIHYFGLGITVLALLVFGWLIFRARPQVQGKEV